MKLKFFLVIGFIFFLSSSAFSETLKGGIYYNVNTARSLAFENIETKININKYKKHFIDTNKKENLIALKQGKTKYKNRYLTRFSDGTYAVQYNNRIVSFYYNKHGNLLYVEFDKYNKHTYKSISYDINGNLDSVSLYVNQHEQFVFDVNKKLVAHWIGKNGYDENGELFGTRD